MNYFRYPLLLISISLYAWLVVYRPLHGLYGNDFKHIYLGMQALLDGSEPYSPQSLFHQGAVHRMGKISLNPYVYLPFTGLALGFLAPLSYPAALLTWFTINHLLTFIFVSVASAAIFPSQRVLSIAGLLTAFALSAPFYRTLTAGQLNIVLLVCASFAYIGLQRGHPKLVGIILGFATCFKLAPGLFFLYFTLQRRWRALASMLATCIILIGASILAVGWKIHAEFLPMLRQMSYGRSTWDFSSTFWKDPPNQSPNSLLSHILVGGNGIIPWVHSTQWVANLCTWAVSLTLLMCYLAAARPRHPKPQVFDTAQAAHFHATLLLSLLLPSLMWDHYLIITILPCAWLVRHYSDHRKWFPLAIVLLCYILISLDWNFETPSFRSGPGLLLMSMKLFPALALFVLGCTVARNSTRNQSNIPLDGIPGAPKTV